MEKHRAMPQYYMTVGEVAKKMKTTVRTMQYYDKEGILSPSAESEGGRRLYTYKDIIKLHQILSMKYLGFSLDDIKTRLVSLETPEEVADALSQQAEAVRKKIASLSETLDAIEKLKSETLKIETVDWKKYADIVVNLQMKNELYGVIKHFDDMALDCIRSRFDMDKGVAVLNTLNRLLGEITRLQKSGTPPDSEQGQAVAKEWWDMVMVFTDGDMSLLPSLIKFAESKDIADEKFMEIWADIEPYINKALEIYFINLGANPFEGVLHD